MHKITVTVSAFIGIAASVLALALPASARPLVRPVTPVVFIVQEHGKAVSPCVLHVGEVLFGIGPAPVVEVVTSLTPDGPVDLAGLSTPLPGNGIFDFRAPAH